LFGCDERVDFASCVREGHALHFVRKEAQSAILNLEHGRSVTGWGRMIFYVAGVDAFWTYLRGKGFLSESPQDASWGERYFHVSDPDGHELSFACPL